MKEKKPICDKCKKPIWEPDATLGDRMLAALEEFATGYRRRPYGFCRCLEITDKEAE